MIADLPPGLILILGALLVPFLPGRLRQLYMLALPLLAGLQLYGLEPGNFAQTQIFGYTLTLLRVDSLSLVFSTIFLIAAFLNVIYGLHERDTTQEVAALVYAGAATSAVFVGDLISLFVFWELTAISSVFLIWARGTERAYRTGMRYLIIQVGSGVILLAGVVLLAEQTGSIGFDKIGLSGLASWLIFIAFGIKAAFPFLHNWLQDAYPEATVTGTVVLSAFTTKLAVYALARGFQGTEVLVYIGAIMTVFPVFFAVIENDLRRVLAFSLNNQVGFMVVGIGDRHAAGHERRRGARLRPHHLQVAPVHVHGRRAAPDRHDKGLGAGRAVPLHAAHHGVLRHRGRLDLGLPAVQRLHRQVAHALGHGRCRAMSSGG